MTKRTFFMLLMAGLFGCVQQMVNPNATLAQAEADGLDCRYEAELATAGMTRSAIERGMRINDLMTLCLRRKGDQ